MFSSWGPQQWLSNLEVVIERAERQETVTWLVFEDPKTFITDHSGLDFRITSQYFSGLLFVIHCNRQICRKGHLINYEHEYEFHCKYNYQTRRLFAFAVQVPFGGHNEWPHHWSGGPCFGHTMHICLLCYVSSEVFQRTQITVPTFWKHESRLLWN